MSTVIVGKVIEIIEHPFAKGDLTSDGIQWSAEVDTTTVNTDVTVESITIDQIKSGGGPGAEGTLIEVEFGLTAAFKAVSSATADIQFKWQARNKGGTWVDLHAYITITDPGTTYAERTRPGRFKTVANFEKVPFDVQLIFQCNEANQGRAKTKNASYITALYKTS